MGIWLWSLFRYGILHRHGLVRTYKFKKRRHFSIFFHEETEISEKFQGIFGQIEFYSHGKSHGKVFGAMDFHAFAFRIVVARVVSHFSVIIPALSRMIYE